MKKKKATKKTNNTVLFPTLHCAYSILLLEMVSDLDYVSLIFLVHNVTSVYSLFLILRGAIHRPFR